MFNKGVGAKTVLCLMLLSVVAMAAPRVAVLKVKTGKATVDGKVVKKVAMLSAQQKLNIPAGSEVRIQLLGANREVTLKGKKSLVISKKSLNAIASDGAERGAVSMAKDIGNNSTCSAVVERGQKSKTKVTEALRALQPSLPPLKRDGSYFLTFSRGNSFTLPDGAWVEIVIDDEERGDEMVKRFDGELTTLELSPDAVVPGERYYFELKANYKDDSTATSFMQSFRILTREERVFLDSAKREFLALSQKDRSILPLLQLASLNQDLDQYGDVLKYLEMARHSPYLPADKNLTTKLDNQIGLIKRSQAMKIRVLVGDT